MNDVSSSTNVSCMVLTDWHQFWGFQISIFVKMKRRFYCKNPITFLLFDLEYMCTYLPNIKGRPATMTRIGALRNFKLKHEQGFLLFAISLRRPRVGPKLVHHKSHYVERATLRIQGLGKKVHFRTSRTPLKVRIGKFQCMTS